MKTLEQISNDSYYKMEDYHQISIDLIQDVEDLFNNQDQEILSEVYILIELLGAKSYDIGVVLDVFNPEFQHEISDLVDLRNHIDNKIVELKEKIHNAGKN